VTGRDKLLAAIDLLEASFAQAVKLGDDNFIEHRKEVIQLRRVILEQNSAIAALCDEAFGNSEGREAFRAAFSKMRSAMAHHQASWPVVSINFESLDYIASLQAMRDANRNFITWVRSALKAS